MPTLSPDTATAQTPDYDADNRCTECGAHIADAHSPDCSRSDEPTDDAPADRHLFALVTVKLAPRDGETWDQLCERAYGASRILRDTEDDEITTAECVDGTNWQVCLHTDTALVRFVFTRP